MLCILLYVEQFGSILYLLTAVQSLVQNPKVGRHCEPDAQKQREERNVDHNSCRWEAKHNYRVLRVVWTNADKLHRNQHSASVWPCLTVRSVETGRTLMLNVVTGFHACADDAALCSQYCAEICKTCRASIHYLTKQCHVSHLQSIYCLQSTLNMVVSGLWEETLRKLTQRGLWSNRELNPGPARWT